VNPELIWKRWQKKSFTDPASNLSPGRPACSSVTIPTKLPQQDTEIFVCKVNSVNFVLRRSRRFPLVKNFKLLGISLMKLEEFSENLA
jgi:hypothetical protein